MKFLSSVDNFVITSVENHVSSHSDALGISNQELAITHVPYYDNSVMDIHNINHNDMTLFSYN